MPTSPEQLPEFPFRTLKLALVFTLCLFGFAGWQSWEGLHEFRRHSERHLRIQDASDDLERLDQLLTNQAHLYAASGDERWRKAYEQSAKEYRRAKWLAQMLVPEIWDSIPTLREDLKRQAGGPEEAALALAAQGQREPALQRLQQPDYARHHQIFRHALARLNGAWQQEVDDDLNAHLQRATATTVVLIAAGGVMLLIWWVVFRVIRRHMRARQQMEAALDQERHLLSTLLETIPDRIYIKDAQSRFVRCSRKMLERFGLQRMEDLAGKTDFDVHSQADAERFFEEEQQIIRTKTPVQGRLEKRVDKDGRVHWSLAGKAPVLDAAGNVTGIVGISREVTALKEAEAELRESEEINRTLLSSLPQRVVYKDCNLVFQGVNQAFAQDVKLNPEDIIGKTDFDFYPPEMAEKFRADDRRVIALGKPVILEETSLLDGQERIVEVVKAPVVDDAGQTIGLVGIFSDITERKHAEQKLRSYAAQLAQNNRELQDFAFVASHDLQEPLRKVRAFGDRLQAKFGAALGPEGLDYLQRMRNAAERMQNLIEALLAYSRVSTRAQPFAPVNLNTIAHEVLHDLEVRLEQTHGQVRCENLPTLEADPMQMRQLLQNLIGNALKFHRPGVPPEITVHARPWQPDPQKPTTLAPEHTYVEILVQDNGIGFDEKYLDRIFGVFQRLHGRGEYEGSGVGLAICRKIVQRHGGDLTARSQPGQGATFIITLPTRQS